jgi:hypothetical protein
VQVAAAPLRRLDLADDPLQTQARVIEDKLDWIDAFSGSTSGCTAPTHQLGQLGMQFGVQMLHESCGEAAALGWCEAQPRVRPDGEFDATAEHLAVAAGMGRPAEAPVGR